MKTLLLAALFLAVSGSAMAVGGSTELVGNRIRTQIRLKKDESKGSFALRAILENNGFKNDDGFVETGDSLAPLEIDNYLYDNGNYVFTILVPVTDSKLFVAHQDKGFISFGGEAAKKLFEVLKVSVPRDELKNLEQYKFTDSSYCDKTVSGPEEYRCWIDN
ncbi:MAG: hypothetical protein ACXWQO_05185 [Bdellovibrionota bacterium]